MAGVQQSAIVAAVIAVVEGQQLKQEQVEEVPIELKVLAIKQQVVVLEQEQEVQVVVLALKAEVVVEDNFNIQPREELIGRKLTEARVVNLAADQVIRMTKDIMSFAESKTAVQAIIAGA